MGPPGWVAGVVDTSLLAGPGIDLDTRGTQPWVTIAGLKGAGAVVWDVLGNIQHSIASGYKKPKVLGGAGSLRHRPCEAHCVGLLKGMLLSERAGVKVLVQHVVQCTDHAVRGRRPSGFGAGGRVPGVATWGPLWHLLLQGPTCIVNLRGHVTPQVLFAASGLATLGLSLQRCDLVASGLPE